MRPADALGFVARTLATQRVRSLLSAAGIGIGIAAVVLLTSLGEGLQRYVLGEFTQFGTNILAITPGKTSTLGISPGVFGTERPLTLADAGALARLAGVRSVVPVVQGNAQLESPTRRRRTDVIGVSPGAVELWKLGVAHGRFLPEGDPVAPRALVVLGANIRRELFPQGPALGAVVRIGGNRFRVVGVLAPKGTVLGFDMDNLVYVPTARAQALFNREALMEIDVAFGAGTDTAEIAARVTRLLERRHGRVDFTVTTQEEMLEVLGKVLDVLTLAVGALGGISLLVGAVGIFTLLTISVQERVPEIGLLKALGATGASIMMLFLGEALALSIGGCLLGIGLAAGVLLAASLLLPDATLTLSPFYSLVALALAAFTGLVTGALPARRAARMDPVEALRAE